MKFIRFPYIVKSKIKPGVRVNGSVMEIKSEAVLKLMAPKFPTDEGLITQISSGESGGSDRGPQETSPSGRETCTSFAGFSVKKSILKWFSSPTVVLDEMTFILVKVPGVSLNQGADILARVLPWSSWMDKLKGPISCTVAGLVKLAISNGPETP